MVLIKKTSYLNRNNVVGGAGLSRAVSLEYLTRTWSRFDFGIHWFGSDGLLIEPVPTDVVVSVSLANDTGNQFPATAGDVSWPQDPIEEIAPLRVEWIAGTLPGTVKENFYSYATLIASRDNVDPGYGSIHIQDTDGPDAGRPGPRYSFQLAGTEYRVHVNPRAGFAERPYIIVASPPDGFPFPLILYCRIGYTGADGDIVVRNIIAGAGLRPTTIYSKRDQIADFGSATINGATNASPIVISTVSPHGWLTGGYVVISGVLGNTAANGTRAITVIDSTHFSLVGSTGNAAYTSGGIAEFKVNRVFARIYQKGRWLGIDGFPVDIDTGVVL